MDSIKITLETLYDILRNEKKREDLQPLDDNFYLDFVSYIREKKALLEMKKEDGNIFDEDDQEKLQKELRNIRRILKELYEKREKKIIDIALNKSRTRSDIIDTSCMLKEEKVFYDKILDNLDTFRTCILRKLSRGDLPEIDITAVQKQEFKAPEPKDENTSIIDKQEDSSQETMRIKFLHATPSFVWKDMKEYGPYDSGEEADIVSDIAKLLIRKERAEKV